MKAILLIGAALLAASCATLDDKPDNLFGAWGGPHVGIVFEGGLANIEYDCASGTIDGPVYPAAGGQFTASGTHRPGQGGPVRVGQIFTTLRAKYSGQVTGDTMTVSVGLENGTSLGPFTLTRGAEPLLTRCL